MLPFGCLFLSTVQLDSEMCTRSFNIHQVIKNLETVKGIRPL